MDLRRLIERIVRPFYFRFRRVFITPFYKMRRLTSIVARAINKFIRKLIAKKDPSLRDYLRLGRYYVAKKLLAFILIAVIVAVYFLVINPLPFMKNLTNKPHVFAKQDETITHTGKARIYFDDKTLKYEGDLKDGVFHDSSGKLYDQWGNLIYEGGFVGDLKDGHGIVYDSMGKMVYRGTFESGEKNGHGEAFDSNGNLVYRGEFVQGIYSGEGMLFYPGQRLKFEGSFQNGRPGGVGTKYYENGEIKYEGNYLAGKYNGYGKLFDSDANMIYEGGFYNGLYSGTGKTYFTNGFIHYSGGFQGGHYSGSGVLYHPNGARKYNGDFLDGKFNGSGELYNVEAKSIYQGGFKDGLFEGLGTITTPEGMVTFVGFFKEGEVYYPGYLGLSGKKVVEILGEPPGVSYTGSFLSDEFLDEEPGDLSLILTYNDYGLELTLKQLDDVLGNSTVVKVKGWGNPLAVLNGDLLEDAPETDTGEPVVFTLRDME